MFLKVYPKFVIHEKTALPSYKAALIEIDKQNVLKDDDDEDEDSDDIFDPAEEDFPFPDSLQQTILLKIGARAGIMLEEQITRLIKTMKPQPGNLIKVETFFEALGITKLEDINFMLKSFMPYLVCEDCDPEQPPPSKKELLTAIVVETYPSEDSSLCLAPLDDLTPITHLELDTLGDLVETGHELEEEVNESFASPVENVGSSESQELVVSLVDVTSKKQQSDIAVNPHAGHNLSLDAAFVHKALKNFALRFTAAKSKDLTIRQRVKRQRITVPRRLTQEDVNLYWKQFEKAFPRERHRTWDALLHGLSKYYEILKDRHKLNEQVQKLRRQNAELKHLLKKCTPTGGPNRVSTAQFSVTSGATTSHNNMY